MGFFNNIGNNFGNIKTKVGVFVEKIEAKSLERLEVRAANAVVEEKKIKHKQSLLNKINKTKKLKEKIKKSKSDAFAKKMIDFNTKGKNSQTMFGGQFKF